MKIVIAILLSLANAWALAGEVRLNVTGPDGLTGTANLVNKILEDGTKYVRLTMKLKHGDGQTTDVLQESSYTDKGVPVRMLQTSKSASKKVSVVVTFTEEGAQVVMDKGDGPKTNFVVRPDGSTANPTELWFVKVQPHKGQVVEYYTFRVSEQTWIKAKSSYKGKTEIVVAGKRVSANLVHMGEVKSYCDDLGDPFRIELRDLKLERAAD